MASNQIGRLLLSSNDLSEGAIVAAVPEHHRDPYAFRAGIFDQRGSRVPVEGGYMQAVPSTQDALSAWVHGVLKEDNHRAILTESFLLRAGDLVRTSGLPRHTVTCGEFVYHWASDDQPMTEVAAVVSSIYPVPLGLGIICTTDPEDVLAKVTLSLDDLSKCVERVDCVLVGAYDGESVVMWVRAGSPIRALVDDSHGT